MGYEAPELTKADILTELNKLLTCTTNKITDAVVARIDANISSVGGAPLAMIDIWGLPEQVNIVVNSTPGDVTLPNVVIPDLGTYTIEKAYAMFCIPSWYNSSASLNQLTTDTFIQVDRAAAGYINAIPIADRTVIGIAGATSGGGTLVHGGIDISSRVINDATTNFKWVSVVVTGSNMMFYSVQTGIKLIVS